MSTNKVRSLLMQVFERSSLTLRDWAHALGVSYPSVRAYRRGVRVPSPEVLRRIASVFRRHAREIAKLADQIEREADRAS